MLSLLLAGLALQDAPQERGPALEPRALVQSLIESTNELDSFRARYELVKDGEVDAEFVLAYSAPGRALLTIERGEDGAESHAETWIVDGVMSVRADDGQGGGGSGDVDLSQVSESIAAASEALAEHFPPAEPGIGPGPILVMSWGINEESNKADFDLKLAYEREHRRALLGWLVKLRNSADELTIEDGRLILDPGPRIHVEVGMESGFIERIDLLGADGSTGSILLRGLELGSVPLGESFEPAPVDPREPNVFAAGAARMRGQPRDFRRNAFARVDGQLAREERSWDESTQDDWRTVLERLHEPFVSASFEAWSERSLQSAREFAQRLAEERAKSPASDVPAELRKVAQDWRDALVQNLDASLGSFSATLTTPQALPSSLGARDELLAIEAEVLSERFELSVQRPLLEAFDALIVGALGE